MLSCASVHVHPYQYMCTHVRACAPCQCMCTHVRECVLGINIAENRLNQKRLTLRGSRYNLCPDHGTGITKSLT